MNSPDPYREALAAQRADLVTQMRAVIATAEAEKRDLNQAEVRSLERLDADIDRRTADIDRLETLATKTAAGGDLRAAIEPALYHSRRNTMSNTEGARLLEMMRDVAAGPVGGPALAFESRYSDQYMEHLALRSERQEQGYEVRALQSLGGSAVQTSFADFVDVYSRTMNPVAGVAHRLFTQTGAPLVIPRITADVSGAGGTVTAEAAGITESDPTVSQITLNPFKFASISTWSSELDEGQVIGLEQLIANAAARPIGLAQGTFYTTGTGTTQPTGYLVAAGTTVQCGTASGTSANTSLDTFFGPSDLIDMFYTLASPYQTNAVWMTSPTGRAKIAKFRSTTGEYLLINGYGAGPDQFLNRPIYTNPAMAAVASASKSVAVGDFSKYVILERQPLRIDVSKEFHWGNDQISLRVIARSDANTVDVNAIRYLVSANT